MLSTNRLGSILTQVSGTWVITFRASIESLSFILVACQIITRLWRNVQQQVIQGLLLLSMARRRFTDEDRLAYSQLDSDLAAPTFTI